VIVPRDRVAANRAVVKHAPFLLVRGRVERDGEALNVVGERFRALAARGLAHRSRDFR
jgi:hypothetical protein